MISALLLVAAKGVATYYPCKRNMAQLYEEVMRVGGRPLKNNRP